ncbi:MAG: DegT/DnrJ/EryC1/StrS family aminotransferase, partial [Planctomycetes bacterium]|nr:DegT/DnrJ/EryC1/StrS family aminotransferase [Planctomycetota bacterium]
RFHRLADQAFARNQLTNDGPLVRQLEEDIAAWHHVRHAVTVANATLAQMLLIKAMLINGQLRGNSDKPGQEPVEAIVAADTFISTAHVCEWLGLTPVFADIEPDTLALSTADVLNRLSPCTRLIIPTHVFGVFADMPAICETAKNAGAAVIADAAHAFDCDHGGIMAGGFGVAEFISFHATKFFSTLEGGAVLTNDDALARQLRELRNFGFVPPGVVERTGINAKLSEISAAFGLASLPALAERRERLALARRSYSATLAGLPGIRVHPLDQQGRNNYRYFAAFIEPEFGASRDAVHAALRRDNVLVRRYFYPGCHRTGYYRQRQPDAPALPNTEKALDSIICLPTSFSGIEPDKGAELVARLLIDINRNAEAVEQWWLGEKAVERKE